MKPEDQLAANLAKLPRLCYAFIDTNAPGERIVVIKAGEIGYYPTDLDSGSLSEDEAHARVRKLNAELKVTQQQVDAMVAGSMFGFDLAGADPDRYTSLH